MEGSIKKTKQELFPGIDIIKFVLAYFVCAVHIAPIKGSLLFYSGAEDINYYLQQGICRIAVPFYFCTAGFLLFKKIDLSNFNNDRIYRYCNKIFRLMGIWTILLLFGSIAHLWFLGGLVIASVILSRLFKKNYSFFIITLIVIVMYLLGLIGDSYSGVLSVIVNKLGLPFIYSFIEFLRADLSRIIRLGLFSSLVFFFMGASFVYQKISLKIKWSIIGILLSLSCLFLEVYLLKRFFSSLDNNMYVSLIPTTYFLFNIAIGLKLNNRTVYSRIRIIGVLVFFLHQLFGFFVQLFFDKIYMYYGMDYSAWHYILTVIITTVVAVIIEELARKPKYSFLRYLYM